MGMHKGNTGKHVTTFNTAGRTTVNPLFEIDVVNMIGLNLDARV
jgi:hypothetical protein